MMQNSLRTLLLGLFDYAGLFPPAKLDFDPAIRNYARFRDNPDAWMLAGFVCPTARIGELDLYVGELFSAVKPVRIAFTGRGGASRDEALSALRQDFADIGAFCDRYGEAAIADAIEVRLPTDWSAGDGGGSAFVETTQAAFGERCALSPQRLWLELPIGTAVGDAVTRAISFIAECNAGRANGESEIGFKLRCGGIEPSAFPSCEAVAHVIATCRDADVPLKYTAGLHHPLRHYREEASTHMHGFVNMFAAGVLAHLHKLDTATVESLLADEAASSFAFNETGMRWGDYHATNEQIADLRARRVLSVGSCSFDEPRDDLRGLGWL